MSISLHTINAITGGLPSQADRIDMGFFPGLPFPAAGSSIASAGAVTAGTGYTSVNTISIAPTGGAGSGLLVLPTSLKVVAAAVAAGGGGAGYVTNDTINLGNGVVLTVTATAGAITGLAVTNAGAATTAPTGSVSPASTSGAGTGARINLTWGLGAVQVTNGGTYTTAPTGFTVTDTAGGTGAAVAAPSLGGAGSEVIVGVSTGFTVPTPYMVQATPSVPAVVRVVSKTNTSFSIGLTPTSGTLGAGTVDAVLLG